MLLLRGVAFAVLLRRSVAAVLREERNDLAAGASLKANGQGRALTTVQPRPSKAILTMAPGQSGVEIFAGYLYKKTRSVFSGWQRRYFVLLKEHGSGSATLKYWHTDKSYRDRPEEARGEISMRVNPGEAIARRVTASQPTMHMRLPGRILEFRSKDDDQIAQWLQAFSKLTDEAAQARGKAVSQQSKATSKDAVSDRIAESSEYDVFSRPIGEAEHDWVHSDSGARMCYRNLFWHMRVSGRASRTFQEQYPCVSHLP